MDNLFYETMKNYSDEEFLEFLCSAEHKSVINEIEIPGFPNQEIQLLSVGSSGGESLRNEGWSFYKLVKYYVTKLKGAINPEMKILDFGCGWGRMIRFYFKDIYKENIYGIDVDPDMINICNETLLYGNYIKCNPHPPTSFESGTFDFIFAYSVFSHLRDDAALSWIQEFSRILKPRGVLVATTQGEGFLDYCKQLQESPSMQLTGWHEMIANCFEPIEETLSKYRAGEFIYAPTGGGEIRDSSFYGEAMVPKRHIENIFGKFLAFRDYFYDISRMPQAVFVMQK